MSLILLALGLAIATLLIILWLKFTGRQTRRLNCVNFFVIVYLPLLLAATLLTSIITINFVPLKAIEYAPKELVAVKGKDSLSGNFALGSGTLTTGLTYLIYVKNEDGSFTPHQVKANQTTRIIEDASLTGVGYWRKTTWVYDPDSLWAKWTCFDLQHEIREDDEIRVPVGSIVHSFELQ